MNLHEWHHGYVAILLIALGVPFGSVWFWAPGIYLIADDAAQHFLGLPSPAKWLYGVTLWRIPAVQRLNRWLDRLLGAA